MFQLDVNTIPFYMKNLSIHSIWYLRGSWSGGYWRTTVCVCVFKFSLKFFSLLLCGSWTPGYYFVLDLLFPFLSCYVWLCCHDLQFSWDLDSFLAFPKIRLCQFSGRSSLHKGSESQSKERGEPGQFPGGAHQGLWSPQFCQRYIRWDVSADTG